MGKGAIVSGDNISFSPYDPIAEFYHREWQDWYLPAALPALERLFFPRVPPSGQILDVCCGSGHVTRELVARGYSVTGIDNSAGLLSLAERDLPAARFLVKDVRNFEIPSQFDGAISTFDSLNHLLTFEDLTSAFRAVHRALRPEALFLFDMNLEEAYSLDLSNWVCYAHGRSIGFVRGCYSHYTKLAETELVWFVPEGEGDLYRKHNVQIEQRCYTLEEIQEAIALSGFRQLEIYTALEAGVSSELGYGRAFFAATR